MIRRTALILLLMIAAPFAAQAQQWVEHRPAGAGYRIEFPREPSVSSQDIQTAAGVMKMHHAAAETGSTMAFVALHMVYPPGSVRSAEMALDRGRDRAVRGETRKLVDERRTAVSGAPALRLVIEETQQHLILVMLIVVRDNNMYQAIVASPKGSEDSPDGERFLSSLALTDDPR